MQQPTVVLVPYKLQEVFFQLQHPQALGRPQEGFFLGFARVIPGRFVPAIHTVCAPQHTTVCKFAGHTYDYGILDFLSLALTAHSLLSCPNGTRVHDLNSPAKAAQSFEPRRLWIWWMWWEMEARGSEMRHRVGRVFGHLGRDFSIWKEKKN